MDTKLTHLPPKFQIIVVNFMQILPSSLYTETSYIHDRTSLQNGKIVCHLPSRLPLFYPLYHVHSKFAAFETVNIEKAKATSVSFKTLRSLKSIKKEIG